MKFLTTLLGPERLLPKFAPSPRKEKPDIDRRTAFANSGTNDGDKNVRRMTAANWDEIHAEEHKELEETIQSLCSEERDLAQRRKKAREAFDGTTKKIRLNKRLNENTSSKKESPDEQSRE